MNRITLIACFLAFFTAIPSSAQRRNRNKPVEPKLTAEQLIQSYRFEEAISVLQKDIKLAQKKNESTEQLDVDIKRATLGADMLRGTEKINFVDSFKVSRAKVDDVLRISPEVGRLVETETQLEKMKVRPAEVGKTAYINELGDRIFFSASNKVGGVKNIWSAYRSGKGWGTPAPLVGMQSQTIDQDFPFVMPDGVTMYYAARGEGSVGGYDLFVTRYDADTKQYLKPENLGMPLNSPANDYFLLIDEISHLGWLVTDRNQSADTVCIYVFIPTESRDLYEIGEDNEEEVLHAAQLHSISECQFDKKAVAAARLRLKDAFRKMEEVETVHHRYVINDRTVYTHLKQFRSEAARRIAMQADKTKEQIDELLEKQDDLHRQVAEGNRKPEVLNQLKQINGLLPQLQSQYQTLCKNMRLAEVK